MKQTRLIMGLPITVEIVGTVTDVDIVDVFDYFTAVDKQFSTYKTTSEISHINHGLPKNKWTCQMKTVLELCEQTKRQTRGFFDIEHNGTLDPSGLVKGWAVNNAAHLLLGRGMHNFYIEAGGDVQVHGFSSNKKPWAIGIRNPFDIHQIIEVLYLSDAGVATSGTYIRGPHIYNPFDDKADTTNVKSLTVVAENVYEADRYATAAFAMGLDGTRFIEETVGLEGYMVDANQKATYTSGFKNYTERYV